MKHGWPGVMGLGILGRESGHMGGGKTGKSDTVSTVGQDGAWPARARRLVTAALLFHGAAVLAGALAAPPSSSVERAVADVFAPYYQVVDQGHAYRYYAPEPGPTPVVTASIRFADGRPEKAVRLPTRGTFPRLRHQRQLALANHLMADFEKARRITGEGSQSAYARSYARHLARSHAGCASVTLYGQVHLIPDPRQVYEAIAAGKAVDIDAEEYFTAPELIGEFPCDGL
jgi:hypothetical protein